MIYSSGLRTISDLVESDTGHGGLGILTVRSERVTSASCGKPRSRVPESRRSRLRRHSYLPIVALPRWSSNCSSPQRTTMTTGARRALAWSAVGAAGLMVGVLALRRLPRSVEAVADEPTRRLPGDELIAYPVGSLTNAVTIHAAPREVWPWLAQMGAGRGGWYSYDRLDNGGEHSAIRIIPQFQHLTRDMIFPALPGAIDGFTVASFEHEQFLVLGWKAPDGSWLVTWTFVLQILRDGATRLIVRVRGGAGYRFHGMPWSVARIIVPTVHFVMERKQLLGIAKRAEAHTVRPAV